MVNIVLDQDEIDECITFSKKCAKAQQEIEFGQEDTKPRSCKEIARDNLIGKIAEVAFAKFMKDKYNIEIQLDFEYYPRGVWDDQDAVINGWRIDVKGTRQGGKWLLIEWNKLRFRKKQRLLSHFYVMSSVGWDRNNDLPTGFVDLVGYATLGQLKKGFENTFIIKKGDKLPGTNTILQADNYGRKFSDLAKDWNKMIYCIKDKEVAETSSYDGI